MKDRLPFELDNLSIRKYIESNCLMRKEVLEGIVTVSHA
jgi:hypothetical protein